MPRIHFAGPLIVAVLATAGLLLAGSSASARGTRACGSSSGAGAAALARPGSDLAWRAGVVTTTRIRATPPGIGAAAPRLPGPHRSISPRQASWLLVLGARRGPGGECWLRVRLPWRPDGATGWVRAGALELRATPWRLRVSRRARTLSVYLDGRRVRRFAVVVGKPSTPTPAGLFGVLGVWREDPASFSGAWILTLTAHSQALRHFEGGDGRVAIHGRGGASLRDPLGSAASHGCTRLANRAIDWLVRTVGADDLAGIPVEVE